MALDAVTLEVSAGECIALVGPNGAGKSTLIKLCLGLLEPSAGNINVLGGNPMDRTFSRVKSRIGFLPEQVMFQPALTGAETMRFYARLKGADCRKNGEIIERVQLSDAIDRRVATYSKGMRQRLGLAQSLIGSPDLLLLDEPMSGLDPEARGNFFSILVEEMQRGAAVILFSHILTELEARTDRVAILSRGRLKALGTVGQLRSELNLHPRIRLKANREQMKKLAARLEGRFGPATFMNGAAVLNCARKDKMDLLRELMNVDATFENLDIIEPGLDQIFAAHTAGKAET